MTREDIECIIKWFSHIEQLATDGKTANGFQMPPDKILATIKVVAKDSREYIEKFCNDSVPNDLEEAAENHIRKVVDTAGHPGWDWTTQDIKDAFIAGAEWQKEQDEKDLSEKIAAAYQLGLADKEKQMMKEAVEGRVFMSFAPGHNQMVMADVDLPTNTKVRVIVLPKEDSHE